MTDCNNCTLPFNCTKDLADCELERRSPTNYKGQRGPISRTKQERIQIVREMLATGKGPEEIAKILGCTARAVRNYITDIANDSAVAATR